ncbi:hypothetical protein OAL35_02100 [bacterium]|nr:hypothetical protein [bacterium]
MTFLTHEDKRSVILVEREFRGFPMVNIVIWRAEKVSVCVEVPNEKIASFSPGAPTLTCVSPPLGFSGPDPVEEARENSVPKQEKTEDPRYPRSRQGKQILEKHIVREADDHQLTGSSFSRTVRRTQFTLKIGPFQQA